MKRTKTIDCDRVDINRIQSLQPFGALVVFKKNTLTIIAASCNTKQLFNINSSDMIRKNITAFFNNAVVNYIKSAVSKKPFLANSDFILKNEKQHYKISIDCHGDDSHIYLEIEKALDLSNFQTIPTLDNLLNTIYQADDKKKLYQLMTTIFFKITHYDSVMIYQYQENLSGTVVAQKRKHYMSDFIGHNFPSADTPKAARDYFTKKHVRHIPDINYKSVNISKYSKNMKLNLSQCSLRSAAPIHIEFLKNMGSISTLSIPIVIQKKLWGIVALHHKEPKYIPKETRNLLSILVDYFSMQVQQFELNEKIFMKENVLKNLTRLSELTKNARKIEDVVEQWIEKISTIIPCDAIICRLDDFYYSKGSNISQNTADKLSQMALSNEEDTISLFNIDEIKKIDRAYSSALLINISIKDNFFMILMRKPKFKIKKWAGNPSKHTINKKSGYGPRKSFKTWLENESDSADRWLPHEILAAKQFQNNFSNIILKEKLTEKAFYDELTGAYNRHYLDEYYKKWLAHAVRKKHSVSLCILDIDFFKKINDKYGHNAGDNVLIELSKLLTQYFREEDYIFRYGGEEFLILLDNTTLKNAKNRCNALRKKVEKHAFPADENKKIKLTISIGLTSILPRSTKIKLESIIKIADQQLYKAKNSGRNKVIAE